MSINRSYISFIINCQLIYRLLLQYYSMSKNFIIIFSIKAIIYQLAEIPLKHLFTIMNIITLQKKK